MKLTSSIISLVAFFSFAAGDTVVVSYNAKYDIGKTSMGTVTCSGYLGGKYPTFGSLPTKMIGGYNGPHIPCGSCWQLGYNHHITYAIAIDTSTNGFELSQSAIAALGGPKGTVQVSISQASPSRCGL